MRWRAYPAYRSSGDDWLGRIPAHWNSRRVKFLFSLQCRAPRTADEVVTAFRDGTVTLRKNRREDGFTQSDKEIGYQGIRIGDLVVHAMDAFAGAIGVSDSDGKSTPVYSVCRPQAGVCAHYYARLLRHMAVSGFIASLSKGIRERSTEFRWNELAALRLPLPPEAEQLSITNFLDRETAKLDTLIAKQERLIELLQEKRQAVISSAVTKGIDPKAPMKDSGVEWLGMVPAHWTVCPLKSAISFQEGPGILADDFRDEGIPLLRVSGVAGRYATLDGCNFLDPEKVARRWQHFRVKVGDLLISASASMGTVTEVAAEVEGAVPYTGIIRLFPIPGRALKEFARHFVVSNSFLRQIDQLKAGATIQHFGPTHLSQMKLALPPIAEQQSIAEFVDVQLAQVDRLIGKADASIELMHEHRSTLISAAVTGKIDVRGFADTQSRDAEILTTA